MKRSHFSLALLSAALFSLTAFAPATINTANEDPYLVKTFSGNIDAVRAETSGGGLTIEGGTDRNAKVEMYVRPNNWNGRSLDKADIDERLRDYDITIEQQGSTIVATAKRRKNTNGRATDRWEKSLSISFKFFTPRAVSTDLNTSGGGISLAGISGKQRFTTSGGGLDLTDVEGDIKGQTSGGGIRLNRCRNTNGTLDLHTSGGGIDASASSGTMRLQTSGGSIEINDLRGDVDVQTSGGSIRGGNIMGELKAGTSGGSIRLADVSGSIDASSSAGSVDVTMVKLGDYVRLSTTAGSVRVNMPLNQGLDLNLSGNRVSVPDRLARFDGNIEKDRVRGKLNGGGIPVNISATSGSVSVNR